jgi:polysaccharide export outer membrane protein
VPSMVDMARIEKARLYSGPYRVVPGDVLEFTMSSLLRSVTAAEVQAAQAQTREERPYICRVSPRGTITLPAVGEIAVAGQSLAEMEEQVIDAYQRYVVLRPSVFVKVLEYRSSKAYIAGAVEKPGVYLLKADQMTLASLLTEAGGISKEGAALVRIMRSKDQDRAAPGARVEKVANLEVSDPKPSAIVLPIVGMNVPFRDVALEEGDTVVVERIRMPLFSVLGLVTRPGNFDYPPSAEYNVAQAIAYAGGFDLIADPHYVTIYRLGADGSVLRIPFHLVEKGKFTEALNTPIRPGDVVAVEHTPRTRMNMFVNNLLRINTGIYISGSDLWDPSH